MNDVNSVTGNTASLAPATTLPGQQLNQEDFLKLMIEQFRAQDPTSPMDPSQMVGQMAQFSQIAATQQMQSSLSQLATSLQGEQVLNSSNLIGRQVLAPSGQVTVSGDNPGGIAGAVNVPGATDDVRVSITDTSGKTVRTLDLGAQSGGLANFQWDGLDAAGKPVAPGTYTLSAGNANAPFTTYVSGPVTGVDTTSTGANLQVGGVGNVSLNQIAQIL
ncbi:MAG TPA: FlgD immunoglobulin-like domain containing protein [Rhodanobacteraceae bacterium]|nr:FlgD immunoglobulin-like domain containing protein [Rhodanobacteraceae bacterium]